MNVSIFTCFSVKLHVIFTFSFTWLCIYEYKAGFLGKGGTTRAIISINFLNYSLGPI